MTLDTSTLHCAVYVLLHCNSVKIFTHMGGWEGEREGGREGGREGERKEKEGWGGEGREGEDVRENRGREV